MGADRISYLGVLTLPALWLGLAAQVQGLDLARRAPWFPLLLMTPQFALYGLLWSGPWAGLFIVPVSRDLVPGGLAPEPLWWTTPCGAVSTRFCSTPATISSQAMAAPQSTIALID